MRHLWCACLLAVLSSAGFANAHPAGSVHKNVSANLPVTTVSNVARKRFEKAMQSEEYLRRAEALDELRSATKADPKFAQALILLSHLTRDPAEQEATRVRAKQNAARVSRGERLLIRWLAGVQEGNYVPAIAAMNDLVSEYPQDQRLAFLAGGWLVQKERYAQAIVVLERAVTLNPDYPAALNELGYAYAFSGDFEKGFAAMDRYVALEPEQPNPHDSYGEILRLAGKFDAALEQYRLSIKIDPNFGSELGVADTYAVMGREEDARDEYARAIVFAPGDSEKVDYELQSAVTWIRENNRKQAEHALRDVVKHAHRAGLAVLESEAQRTLALYEPDYKAALKHLDAAGEALQDHRSTSRSDQDDELARLLRVRASRAAEAQATAVAQDALKQLEAMAQTSRSQVVQLSYHAAAGALSAALGNYTEAIPHLEEDSANPLSMRLLWQSYEHAGANSQAEALATKLAVFNVPTIEQALVVPQFRASLISQERQP